jgi:FAD:protein FMN transferase
MQLSSFPFAAMGTDCVLHLYADDQQVAAGVADAAVAEALRIEGKYSRYRPDSVLSSINQVADLGGAIDVDDETASLVDYAIACFEKSGGLFDITSGILRTVWNAAGRLPSPESIAALLPRIGLEKVEWNRPRLRFRIAGMELDLGGLGKEYAVDRLAQVCESAGLEHGLIDLGGDLRSVGPRPGGLPWTVHIRDPRAPETALAVLDVAHGSVATSGDYARFVELDGRRYSHILNPHTGYPVHGLRSVSVLSEQCLVAGSISSIAMLKGLDGVGWLDTLGVQHLWMDESGAVGGNVRTGPPTTADAWAGTRPKHPTSSP